MVKKAPHGDTQKRGTFGLDTDTRHTIVEQRFHFGIGYWCILLLGFESSNK